MAGRGGEAVQDAAREIVLEKFEFVGDLGAKGDACAAERHLKKADQHGEDDVDRQSLGESYVCAVLVHHVLVHGCASAWVWSLGILCNTV